MGYTHYWYRPETLNPDTFKKFTADCKKICDYSEQIGIDLANGFGEPDSKPEITEDKVWLNGSDKQRTGPFTTSESITIPWPSPTASLHGENPDPIADKTDGQWFAGDLVNQRVAPVNNNTGYGSGSYETFAIDQYEQQADYAKDKKLVFNCAKTAYRPYDLTVTACLIAFKHHFGAEVRVATDGEEKDWLDARILCNNVLGYGMNIQITDNDF